jgi:excisionase family DNA binding protein
MTINQAAESLGLAPATVRIQIGNGAIKARRMGGRLYVSEIEVERYRAESRGKARGGRPKKGTQHD